MNEMEPIFERCVLANYTSLKSFTSWKVSANICNFRVPVYKEVPLTWMIWNPSFTDECWLSILVWKVTLSEKWGLNYTTLGFPFIKGLPSHEWNDTHLLTMIAGQEYDCEKFLFVKSGCYTIQILGSRLLRGSPPMNEMKHIV